MTSRTASAVACSLAGIADRLARLAPSHRDPEQYHVEKNELVHELHELARVIDLEKSAPQRCPFPDSRQRKVAS